MKQRFLQSRFSTHFNRLSYLGMWSTELFSDSIRVKCLISRVLGASLLITAIIIQLLDLYFVLGNFRRVTYNFCTSVIVVVISIKVIILYGKRDDLDQLRFGLWKDSVKLKSPEDIAIQDLAYEQLKKMQRLFYVSFSVFLPVWILCSYYSYLWGPRQLAFAGYLPMDDIMDDRYYIPAITYQAACGFYIVLLLIEADLSMFSVVLQMKAFYQILSKNLLKLNDIYEDEKTKESKFLTKKPKREVSTYQGKKANAKRLLKSLIIRQLEILRYIKHFELIYNQCMLVQVFGASFLVVMNGLELSMFMQELSAKLFFQSGYVILIIVDIFLICYHLARLTNESLKIGIAAYSTVWYKMDTDIRKSLCMIIIRSQKPPPITAGKFFRMDLITYLNMMKNIYSWLMLFRQMGSK